MSLLARAGPFLCASRRRALLKARKVRHAQVGLHERFGSLAHKRSSKRVADERELGRPPTAGAFVFFGHVNIDFRRLAKPPMAPGRRGPHQPFGSAPSSSRADDCLRNGGNPEGRATSAWRRWPRTIRVVLNGTVLLDSRRAEIPAANCPIVQQQQNGDPKPGYHASKASRQTRGPFHLPGSSYISCGRHRLSARLDSREAFVHLEGRIRRYTDWLVRHDQSLRSGFYMSSARLDIRRSANAPGGEDLGVPGLPGANAAGQQFPRELHGFRDRRHASMTPWRSGNRISGSWTVTTDAIL